MAPNVWTSEDEELWHAYARAALPAAMHNRDKAAAEWAAERADAMLEEHRRRFPRREPREVRGDTSAGEEERCGK